MVVDGAVHEHVAEWLSNAGQDSLAAERATILETSPAIT